MSVVTKNIKLKTNGTTEIIDITGEVESLVSKAGVNSGIVCVFVPGSTGGLTTLEYEPGLIHDLKAFFEKVAPKSAQYEHNQRWHDGNGYSHVRASLMKPSLSIPFVKKALQLGTWQQIVFIDFDNKPRSRELIVQIIGE